MKIEATVKVVYEVPDEVLQAAFGTSDHTQIVAAEREALDEDGVYLMSLLSDGDSDIVDVREVQ